MKKQNMMDEQGISFSDFLWSLLEQWRAMLVAGLIFALLLAGAKYISNMRAYRHAMSEAGKQAEAVEKKYVGQENVLKALVFYDDWQNQKDYYESNPLMKIDPTHEERYVLRYYISAEDYEHEDLVTVEDCYRLMTSDQGFADAMSICFGDDVQKKYIRELFMISSMNAEEPSRPIGRGFSVVLTLPPRSGNYDLDLIRDTVTDYIKAKSDTLKKVFGEFDVELLSSDHLYISYPMRGDTQLTAFNKVLSCENKFNITYSALSASEKLSVDKIVGEGDVKLWLLENRVRKEKEGEQTLTETATAPVRHARPGFPKKYSALGFLIGLILFAGVLFFQMVFSRKLRDENEFENISGLRSFGGVYKYPYTSVWDRFFHDKKIYELRHRTASKSTIEAARIIRRAAAKAAHIEVANVCLIVLGTPGKWTCETIQKQSDILNGEKISASVVFARDGISSIDEKEYGKMGSALIVTLSNVTTPAMVAELINRLEEYHIPILGTEFIEGA